MGNETIFCPCIHAYVTYARIENISRNVCDVFGNRTFCHKRFKYSEKTVAKENESVDSNR